MFAMAIIPSIVLVVSVLILLGYVKAPPDKAFIITGLKKEPKVLRGKAGIRIPFLERKDVLLMRQMSVDIKTSMDIPTSDFIGVMVDAIAKIQVDDSPEGIKLAQKNFLNMSEEEIVSSLTDSLQGNMREIVGTMTLKELSTNREEFGNKIQSAAQKDMAALGIKIISCNIQSVTDKDGLINDLGQDNMSQIRKTAAISKAEADRDVAIRKAETAQEANEAQVIADTAIAERQNELDIKRSALEKAAKTAQAEADAAYEIQQQEQRKTIETVTADANLVKQEKEITLKERAVVIKERELEASIKKQADAKKYATQQEADAEQYEAERQAEADLFRRQKDAEADLIQRQKNAEAEKYEAVQQAEALKAQSEAERISMENEAAGTLKKAEAEAAGIRAKGEAEASAIQAKALAEAEGTLKKAEAMKQYGEAAKMDMQMQVIEAFVQQLPKIAEAVATPLANVDSITMYGDGNAAKMTQDITASMKQIISGFKDGTGIDPTALLSGFIGAKIADNNDVE